MMNEKLHHSQAELVRTALVILGLGMEPGVGALWPVFASFEPSSPDDCLCTFDTASMDHGRTMPDSERQMHRGCQVRVRSLTHRSGYRKASDVAAALDGLYHLPVTVEGVNYLIHSFNRTGDVVVVGKEYPEGARSYFTVNGLLVALRVS